MGRPYKSEMSEFNSTYAWSMDALVESLSNTLAGAAHLPLIAVGSGGSLPSASVAVALQMQFAGQVARVMTPYDLAMSPLSLKDTGVLLCTAGGTNPDVLSCFEGLVRREPALLAAICTRRGTPLAKVASLHDWTFCHEFPAPVKKDGFLATNSLLATIVLLVRAYEHMFSVPQSLPVTLDDLLHPGQHAEQFLATLDQRFQPLCPRRTLVVLHGHMTQPAAVDIESRFTEAALGNVQLADFRNFAHGRHHWLAQNAEETAVLLLSSPEDTTIAERTAALLPKSIPVLHLNFAHGLPGMLSAVLHSIYLSWLAAKATGIDPGRPKVAQFGRRLYRLRAIPKPPPTITIIPAAEAIAIERKSRLTISTLSSRNQIDTWRSDYRVFHKKVTTTSYHGVIFDYDGTLCSSSERFTGLRKEVVSHLTSLLRAGIIIGIATGRGKSVKNDLRTRIRPTRFHKQILIGYHNASEIGLLDDDNVPPEVSPLHERLNAIHKALSKHSFVSQHCRLAAKGGQITLETTSPLLMQSLWNCVCAIVRCLSLDAIQIVQSTHSIDILAPGISKQSLVTAITGRLGHHHRKPAILCIGDCGQWPGNDFDLLRHPFALSVDQVSSDPITCWNLAPPNSRHVEACLFYLRHFEVDSGAFRLTGLTGRDKSR
jgi:fructoselysine-6-P-deglycase FrlB-like protein